MKTILKLAMAVMATFAIVGGAHAQSNSASNSAAATIFEPLVVTAGDPLLFGGIVSPPAAGTVEVAAATGARTPTGVVLVPSLPGQAATFDILGQALATYEISASDASVTLTSGPNSMTATLNYISANGGTFPNFGLDGAGADTVNVGGVLSVGATQPAGVYSGLFTLEANYN